MKKQVNCQVKKRESEQGIRKHIAKVWKIKPAVNSWVWRFSLNFFEFKYSWITWVNLNPSKSSWTNQGRERHRVHFQDAHQLGLPSLPTAPDSLWVDYLHFPRVSSQYHLSPSTCPFCLWINFFRQAEKRADCTLSKSGYSFCLPYTWGSNNPRRA